MYLVSLCLGRGSNPHVHKGHRILSPVRLPIPPPKQLTLNKLARLVLEVQMRNVILEKTVNDKNRNTCDTI